MFSGLLRVMALIAFGVAIQGWTGPATSQDTNMRRPEDLIGTWSGTMMNVRGSVRGIVTQFSFSQDSPANLSGTASFHNLDLNTMATGTIAEVKVDGNIVTFPLKYRGGAPGVDGTLGLYRLRFVGADTLEGGSENRETQSYLRLRLERKRP